MLSFPFSSTSVRVALLFPSSLPIQAARAILKGTRGGEKQRGPESSGLLRLPCICAFQKGVAQVFVLFSVLVLAPLLSNLNQILVCYPLLQIIRSEPRTRMINTCGGKEAFYTSDAQV